MYNTIKLNGSKIFQTIKELHAQIRTLAQQYHRDPNKIQVLAVSKLKTSSDILRVYTQGQRLFGENRVQEAEKKFLSSPLKELKDIELHLIGTLQRNKVKKALQIFDCIQSVDRQSLAEELVSVCNTMPHIKTKSIFLQVNPIAEKTKSGFVTYQELKHTASFLRKNKNFIIRGLMTIAPFDVIDKHIIQVFSETREWARQLELEYKDMLELSMGMSNDFHLAISQNATMIRIGSALFGERT